MRLRAMAILISAMMLLSGCAMFGTKPSPVTSATAPSGDVVRVDWVDYPAHAGIDGQPLLEYPDQSELPSQANEVVTRIAEAIEAASGTTLEPLDPQKKWFSTENWYPQVGNGYGGDSMLITVNCCDLRSDTVPPARDWQAVVDAASAAAIELGLSGFAVEPNVSGCSGQDTCWLWTGTASDGVQWVYVTIQDGHRDPTGDAAREAEEIGWPPASIALGYGATVVKAGKRAAFTAAMQPFLGQNRPDATTSD